MSIGNSLGRLPETALDCQPRVSTITERLQEQKQKLESELKKVDNALSLIIANPEYQKIIDAISKVTIY